MVMVTISLFIMTCGKLTVKINLELAYVTFLVKDTCPISVCRTGLRGVPAAQNMAT